MPPPPTSLPLLVTYLYASNTLNIKSTSNRKETIEEKLFQTFDLAVSLIMFQNLIGLSADYNDNC